MNGRHARRAYVCEDPKSKVIHQRVFLLPGQPIPRCSEHGVMRQQGNLTGQGLYERASDEGAAAWGELSPEGRLCWRRDLMIVGLSLGYSVREVEEKTAHLMAVVPGRRTER